MRIILDPQIFNIQTYGGISRYYTEIFSRLKNFKEVQVFLPVYETKNVYLSSTKLMLERNNFIFKILNFLPKLGISTRSIIRKKTESVFVDTIKNNDFDVFVPTYYNPYFLKSIGNKPFVLTVYDMIHELFPQYFVNDTFNVLKNKIVLLDKATKIIAVSNNTKKDILYFYPHIEESKIEVIYHGCSIKYHATLIVDFPKDYILFVGSRDNYKNFVFLVNSIKQMLIDSHDIKLLCLGGGKFNDEEIDFITKNDLKNKVIQKKFEESELATYYKNAICFVFPSAYEGFGIPVLEAMMCECPVVLAKISSFPEVAGDAGVYFDINSPKDLNEKIKMLMDNQEIRLEFVKKGVEQSKKFSWDKAAKECLEIYNKAIK